MDSAFTLSIDWLAFTVLASRPEETTTVLGGGWSEAETGVPGYPLSWIRSVVCTGWGNSAQIRIIAQNEIHVDLLGGLVSALTLEQIRALLRWVHQQQGHVSRIDCVASIEPGAFPFATIR